MHSGDVPFAWFGGARSVGQAPGRAPRTPPSPAPKQKTRRLPALKSSLVLALSAQVKPFVYIILFSSLLLHPAMLFLLVRQEGLGLGFRGLAIAHCATNWAQVALSFAWIVVRAHTPAHAHTRARKHLAWARAPGWRGPVCARTASLDRPRSGRSAVRP